MVEKVLALNVRIQRKKRGITIRDLAKLINVRPSFYHRLRMVRLFPQY